jgi:glucose/arabinose dehydrogenase
VVPLRADVPSVSVIATGLNDPRGLAFGPDKRLYIAEAGTGGSISTVGLCDQLAPPVGPVLGGSTARVMVLEPGSAAPTIVAAGLPSAEASPLIGGDRQGVADVTFIGDHLLALVSGAGCSHGHADANNAILKIDRAGHAAVLADLSVWLIDNPGAKGAETPRNPDYERDGTWYSLTFENGRLYAVEPNHGLLVSVNPATGSISLINDLFATFGDHTYTTLAADRGDLYVGTLGRIAFVPGVFPPVLDLAGSFEAGVYRLSPDGAAVQVVDGLHAVLGLAFDDHHRLYVLQSPIFVPGTGSLVRVEADGTLQTVVPNLVFPSGLTRGPDGALYVSECGYHCQPGDGRILRVAVE